MRGRRARTVVDATLGLEQPDLEPLPGECERGDDADGAAAGDDDGTLRCHAEP